MLTCKYYGLKEKNKLEYLTHLPGLIQPAHCWVAQAHNDSKEGVKVPTLLTALTESVKRRVIAENEHNCIMGEGTDMGIRSTHCAAILMNLLRSCTRLLS